MAIHPKITPRSNDIYPAWDITAVNNVGSPLNVGDLVILDWTAPGVANSLVSPSSNFLMTTRMKGIVLPQPNQAGIPVGVAGTIRVQGVCNVGLTPGIAVTAGDAIATAISTNTTDNGLTTALSVTAPGTNPTYIMKSVGAFLVTTASSSSAQTVSAMFDGTDINVTFLKD